MSRITELRELAAEISAIEAAAALVPAKDAEIARLKEEYSNALVQVSGERDRAREELLSTAAKLHDANNEIMATRFLLDTANAEIARLTALIPPPQRTFILGDGTRKQFLGAPFTAQCPGCYESEFYRSGFPQADRPKVTIDRQFVLTDTMPDWRGRFPNSKYWWGDIEWFNSRASDQGSTITAAEVAKVLPAFEAARQFADAEGKGLLVGAYMLPKRFGVDKTDAEVRAQAEVYRPILSVLNLCILTLYALYPDLEKSRTYIRRNIAMGRELMPGKKLIVLGAPYWHSNVGAPLANTPLSAEWQRMFLDEVYEHADGYAPWLPAAYPKPTDEPWWLEAKSWGAARAA